MITAAITGLLVGLFGETIEKRVRRVKDSLWVVLAAFALLGAALGLVVAVAGWVL